MLFRSILPFLSVAQCLCEKLVIAFWIDFIWLQAKPFSLWEWSRDKTIFHGRCTPFSMPQFLSCV